MYRIYYGDKIVYDPFSPDEHAYEVSCYGGINDKGDMSFSIPFNHPLYSEFKVRDQRVTFYNDDTNIFCGYITQIEKDFNLTLVIKCSGIMGYLGDVMVRPYSTSLDDVEEGMQYVSPSPQNLFQWYIDQYNKKATLPFQVGVNEAERLSTNTYLYRYNTSISSVGDEIQTQLIDTLGGYLYVRNDNGSYTIDYFSDVSEVNTQIIDFGVLTSDTSLK